jgi:hypothetical protein
MILHDLQDGIKNGTWSIGRLAFFGGAYGVVAGPKAFLAATFLSLSTLQTRRIPLE